MPLTVEQPGRRGIKPASLALVLALGLVWLIPGCATTPRQPAPRLTGNLLIDGPSAVESGPPKDRVLWAYRTAAAAMRAGDFDLAKRMLDDALLTLGGIGSGDKGARQARSHFHREAGKTFIGEPYERSMAYIYRGILYWMDGEPDNARACFRSAQIADADAENNAYAGDWVLADYLDGYATAKLGGDGTDALERARKQAKNVTLPPYNTRANVLFFIEFGPGPVKYAGGQYGEQLRFSTPASPVTSAELTINGMRFPIAPSDDVSFQATTRGGRVMDHILGNKAVFKSTTSTIGDAALIGGLGTAVLSRNSTAQQVGLGIAFAGLLSKAISSATTPEADIRMWDNLPRHLSFASLELPAGEHQATLEFKNASGRVLAQHTKSVTIKVPPEGDRVVFISDKSTTPQIQ
jgi:hypothetical protein